jgi:N-acetyl-gamma-glutamyl-phosphate reductase
MRDWIISRCLLRPSAGYAQGMIVEVPLPLHSLPSKPRLGDLHAALAGAYDGERFIEVATPGEASSVQTLAPESLNGTNEMKLYGRIGNAWTGEARGRARQSRKRRLGGLRCRI